MIVSSPRRDMPARKFCPKVNLNIRGIDLVVNLIVLDSKGIDVILGMDWLSKHKVLKDYAKKFVKLTTQDGKELEYVVELLVTAKGATNCVKLNQLQTSYWCFLLRQTMGWLRSCILVLRCSCEL
jgi:hypothetical protein